MAQIQNAQYFPYFLPPPPHFTPPPPPRNHPSPPPPKVAPPHLAPPPPPRNHPSPSAPKVAPPPPSHVQPPPPHTLPPSPPHPISPPPPPHDPIAPPPPHVTPPPPPHDSTVIILVFVSIGGVFFLAFIAAALFCFIKKKKKTIADRVKIDEHVRIHEDIVPGPHGTQTVVMTIDDDLHIQEQINNTELLKSKGGSTSSIFKHPHDHQ